MSIMYDTIVIGAGIEGSATAYYSAKDNKRTLLLEQFFLPHTRGSSHGQSRIIRKAYTHKHYAMMMDEAYTLWEILETEAGNKLYHQTGVLAVTRQNNDYYDKIEQSLAESGSVYQKLTGAQINNQFPMLKFESSDKGLYETEAGVLLADKCLQSYHKMFVRYGGHLKDGEPVTKIIPGKIVTVVTSKGTSYQAGSVVITAGPWTCNLTRPLALDLPLQPMKAKVFYWTQKEDLPFGYGINNNCPVVLAHGCLEANHLLYIYALPALEYPNQLKLCSESQELIDPDNRDVCDDKEEEEMLSKFIDEHYPGLGAKPTIRENCITTYTPDTDFIIDRHPEYKNIVIGAGFSGHGFKMAPVIGRILHQLAANVQINDDLSKFTIKRFSERKTKSKL